MISSHTRLLNHLQATIQQQITDVMVGLYPLPPGCCITCRLQYNTRYQRSWWDDILSHQAAASLAGYNTTPDNRCPGGMISSHTRLLHHLQATIQHQITEVLVG